MDKIMLFVSAVAAHWLFTFGGIAMVGFGLYEKYKHKQTAKWVFWGLAAVLLLAAFYQAWQDEHGNSSVLIEQKSALRSQYNQCDKERALKSSLAESYAAQDINQQRLLDSQQQTFNQCILTLGNASKPERQVTQAYYVGTIHENLSLPLHSGDWVVVTNKTITPVRLLVTCDGTIDHASGQVIGTGILTSGGWGGLQAPHTYGVGINSPAWTPLSPLLVTIYSRTTNLGNCDFSEQ